MKPDTERYSEILDEARRWLKAEAGLTVDADDPSLLAGAIALHALRTQEDRFEEVSKRAVERASDPLRENMNRQIKILQGIAKNFERAAGEGRQMADARDSFVAMMQDLRDETKPLVSDMALTRQMLEKQAQASEAPYSPALLAVAGFAILVSGIAIGMMVTQAML